jgi:hypothetical protein
MFSHLPVTGFEHRERTRGEFTANKNREANEANKVDALI